MSTSTSTPSAAGHDHDSPEAIRASIRKYVVIGGILYVMTVVTVIISYVDLGTIPTIVLGMTVAAFKASLVALFFMHLIDEKKLIYYTLGLTVFMFAICMLLPSMTTHTAVGDHQHIDVKAQGEGHHEGAAGGDHGKAGEHGGATEAHH